jgi:hypothetical protein
MYSDGETPFIDGFEANWKSSTHHRARTSSCFPEANEVSSSLCSTATGVTTEGGDASSTEVEPRHEVRDELRERSRATL